MAWKIMHTLQNAATNLEAAGLGLTCGPIQDILGREQFPSLVLALFNLVQISIEPGNSEQIRLKHQVNNENLNAL